VNTFALEIWDNEAAKCTFYTVRWDGARENETDKFFNKYYSIAGTKQSTQELLSFVLDSIGQDQGKVTIGEIVFLYPNFPLRLYALRVNNRNDLVILFNGGIKSAQTNQNSKDLNLKWIEACRFAKRIEEAFRDKEIIIDSKKRKILSANGDDEILL